MSSPKSIRTKKSDADTRNRVSETKSTPKAPPIAVIGMGCLFPGSQDKEGFWRDITAGRDTITEVPPSHFLIDQYYDPDPSVPDKTYCRRGAFLSPVEFDPMAFSIPPANLAATDTSQLLSLLVAEQVLTNAFDGKLKSMDRSRISVILGVAAGLELLGEMANRLVKPNWIKGMREAGLPENEIEDICKRIMATHSPWKESTFPGLLGNVVAGRIANHFDLGGINCTNDAACASSLSAMSQGLNELYAGTSDVVIVGGADTNNDTFLFVSFSKTPALSPTHDCRPFSDKADGMVLGEGIGMVAIKRLDDAERDGDPIYAVIRGIGASSDGKGTSIYAPLPKGQALALRRCYAASAYGPETVELLEAHGTATKPGDKAEIEALTSVFGHETNRTDKQWCALGSVKSQIGHTKSAAAAAGIIKAVMGIRHKVLPPTIKVERPNPLLKLEESPFYVNTQCRPWVRDDSHPRRASISSFGFGGTNFHLTVEEYKGPGKSAWRLRNVPTELVILGAQNAKALEDLCRQAAKDLNTEGVLTYIAKTSQEAFDSSCPARLAIVASNERDLETKLHYAAKALSEKPGSGFSLPNGLFCAVEKAEPGDIAFLFPGQGTSGCLDMGADLAMQFNDAMNIWDFSASFDKKRGAREFLHKVVFPIPAFTEAEKDAQHAKLARTEWAQPGVLTSSISMSAILKGLGIKPDCVGGHSLGEITALYDAGVLDLESLLSVCFKRGELMAGAAQNPGTMTAALCDIAKAQAVLDKIKNKNKIIIANHNSPSQVVFSGPVPDMEAVETVLKAENIKFRRLPVSAAFHSSLMSEVCASFLAYMKEFDFKKPTVPIYSNATGKPHQNKPDKIREALANQIDHPVQFVKEIESMYAAGVRTFIEVGSGAVLTSFVDKILSDKPHTAINMDTKKEHGITGLWKALARLVISGVTPDFSYLWKEYAPIEDPRKREKPKFSVMLSGTNYGKPYPPAGGISDYPKPNPPRVREADKEPDKLNAAVENRVSNTGINVNTDLGSQAAGNQATQASIRPQAPPLPFAQEPISVQRSAPPHTPTCNIKSGESAWVKTFQDIQRQTTEAHSAYLKFMADSHLSFLKTAESSNIAFSSLLTGGTGLSGGVDIQQPPMNSSAGITAAPEPKPVHRPSIPAASMEMASPTPEPEAPYQSIKAPTAEVPVSAPVETPVVASSPSPPASSPTGIDFTEMLLDVVADKTGYPKEILTLEMDLELDLGIDSIKRVEIFSAINEENPWIPEVDPSVMAEIKTLGDVVDFIGRYAPSIPASAQPQIVESPVAQPAATPVAASNPSAPASLPTGIDFTEMLLDVVADKTGYPKEILTLEMDLELDLGIDSIKRVEIFSAINEENPWIPEIDPSVMAEIKTLGDVVDFIGRYAPSIPASAQPQVVESPVSQSAATPVAASNPSAPASLPTGIDFPEMLLDVVADKTGYPKEILTLEMDLELDLGIDSIKRVEIFSAINEENPWIPEIDPSVMAEIKTLGDVVDFIGRYAPSISASTPSQVVESPVAQPAATPVVASNPSAPASLPTGIDFTEMLLDVVADKTGYPKEILTLEMDLELDLGIDSIKRVEIFSAINEENPWIPEVDPSVMAEIKTLSDVVDFVKHSLDKAVSTSSEPSTPEAQRLETSATETIPGIDRYVLRLTPVSFSGFSMPGLLEARHLCITNDETGIAKALAAELEKNGITATVVENVPDNCDGLIFLGGLRKIANPQDAIHVNHEAFAAAQKIAAQLTQSGGILVTVQNTGGDFGLSGQAGDRVWLCGLTGLVKTAAIEWPKASVKAIDIDRGKLSAKKLAAAICLELMTGGPDLEVGIKSDGSRYCLKSYRKPASESGHMLNENDVIVASGGARGITAKALIQLARDFHPRLVLLGRTHPADEPACCRGAATDAELKVALLQAAKAGGKTVKPMDLEKQAHQILAAREMKSNIDAMRQAGSDVKYVVADVQNETDISNALDTVRKEWGGITGIIHGAGVLADKLIAEKSKAQFDRVFDTKVQGLRSLLNATAKDPLKVICFFSSIAGRTGNMGQSDYAMANEILNKVADAEAMRRKGKCLVKSLNWGPWDSGMVSPLLKAHFKEAGIPLLPMDAGVKYFVKEITENASEDVEVVIGPDPNFAFSSSPITRELNLSLLVNKKNYPFMDSHRIKEMPVVPVAMVIEWFARTAQLYNPDMNYMGCKDLKVLKGIKLDNFITGSDHFTICCRQENGDRSFLELDLLGPDKGAHYKAKIEMSAEKITNNNGKKPRSNGIPKWKWDVSDIYTDKLFHGPEFQVIKSLKGVSSNTATAVLGGIDGLSWPQGLWKFDVAALDGGLQLAILWGLHNSNKKSLPTKIGAFYAYQNGPINGPIDCILDGKSIQNGRTLSDISFFDKDGKLAAKLCDVEMHMLPDSTV